MKGRIIRRRSTTEMKTNLDATALRNMKEKNRVERWLISDISSARKKIPQKSSCLVGKLGNSRRRLKRETRDSLNWIIKSQGVSDSNGEESSQRRIRPPRERLRKGIPCVPPPFPRGRRRPELFRSAIRRAPAAGGSSPPPSPPPLPHPLNYSYNTPLSGSTDRSQAAPTVLHRMAPHRRRLHLRFRQPASLRELKHLNKLISRPSSVVDDRLSRSSATWRGTETDGGENDGANWPRERSQMAVARGAALHHARRGPQNGPAESKGPKLQEGVERGRCEIRKCSNGEMGLRGGCGRGRVPARFRWSSGERLAPSPAAGP